MRYDPKSITDGLSFITGGVNSLLPPEALQRTQLAWAVNTTFRSQFAAPRPGWLKRTLRFVDSDGQPDTTLRDLFQDGIFQGALGFERRNQLVTMIGGHLFRIAMDTWNVLDITPYATPSTTPPTLDPNPSNRYRAWFCEAEDFIIVQDGQSAPMIYDGASTVRSDTFGINGAKQVPSGQAMVYSGGRLLAALTDARSFVVGDIVGGDSGTPAYDFRDAILYFTENDIIDGGGSFSVPINAGPLTAFRPVAQVDTSTGQGPTQVFTTGAIFSLNAPTDRTTWSTVNFPIGTVSMVSSGSLSDRATLNINGDIWSRAMDGIRSFIVARRDFATWVNAPMSNEITRAISRDDPTLLSHASAALFDNRLLMTVNPYRKWGHGICHRGLAVLDFSPIAFLNTRVPPIWEGLWTGLQILQILSGTFQGVERCFIFALNSSSGIELWELTRSRVSDSDGSGNTPIQWAIETASFDFPRRPDAPQGGPSGLLQRLGNGQLWADTIQGGDVSFSIQYRPDSDPCWHDWHSWTVCATTELCATGSGCATPLNYQAQYRKPFRLPRPADTCDTAVNKPPDIGYEFQARLEVTGYCVLKRLELTAYDEQQDVTGPCAGDEECAVTDCCPSTEDDWTYTIADS